MIPTPQQNELFILSVKNFIDIGPSHLRILADKIEQPVPLIEHWLNRKKLPDLTLRSRILNWIWSHNCNCSCIKYPYLPVGRIIKYVAETHPCMIIAKEVARRQSLDRVMPTGTIVIKDGFILGRGTNGSDHHQKHGCERVRRQCLTGEGYELCEGCHPKNHSEPRALKNALSKGHVIKGADLYLWGHWWCCRWCWDAIIEAGIANVFLVKNSEILFNKEHPDNIVGKQFG